MPKSNCPWAEWRGSRWFCKETEDPCVFSSPSCEQCDIYQGGCTFVGGNMSVTEKIAEIRKFVDIKFNPFRVDVNSYDWSDLLNMIDDLENEYRREINEPERKGAERA